MTDKQIIIDDVDVSGCGFIAKEDKYSLYDRVYKGQCRCFNEEMCKDHPNCFYKKALKQLKCKEKECEELKRIKNDFFKHAEVSHEAVLNKNKIIDEQAKELDQLKAENEELKKKIKYMEEYIKTVENSRNEFEKESKFLKEEIEKL